MNETTAEAQPTAAINPPPEPRRVRQVVHDYFSIFQGQDTKALSKEQLMNPFVAYTNLGTDFGFIGKTDQGIGCEDGQITIAIPDGTWVGMWHSLRGMASDREQNLDFNACYPPFVKAEFQPRIIGVEFRARGRGTFKLEIKSATQETIWIRNLHIDSPDVQTLMETIDPQTVGPAKYLNWVAEGGTTASLDSLAFIMQAPAIPFDEHVFLASYAKLARCYSPKTGFVRDRAHLSDAIFDNVPACGLFALSSVLASRTGMVADATARDLVRTIHANVSQLPTAQGWLPHFVRREADGKYGILPGTEFSVVDTSIYYHAMLLAGEILQDEQVTRDLTDRIRAISFDNLVDGEGYIRHGIRSDKTTPLVASWRDWGGETALVLALAKMTGRPVTPKMLPTGRVYDGTGFIAEIQSLFYPDFNSSRPDLVSRQNWLQCRQTMLTRQKEYFPNNWPQSRAAQLGFYGLSAGESRHGMGYMVSGVDLPQQSFIYPHYVLMSGCLEPDPKSVYALLRRMEDEQLFPPWGLVEHFTKEVSEYLPMQGALNAGLECLGAYHLLMKHRAQPNLLNAASVASPSLRKGASVFYASNPTGMGSKTGRELSSR